MSSAAPGTSGQQPALFLDFDGTLVDIAATPDAVIVTPGLPELLSSLRARLGGALAIVTGRPVAGVDQFLPGLGLDACGMHGLERRIAGHTAFPDDLADLSPRIEQLRARLAVHPGVIIEDKRVGVAVHWRTAPDAERDAKAAIDDLARDLGPAYKVQDGKAVSELVPARAGKGEGVRALMQSEPYMGRRPIFVGDDKTDEYGFAAVDDLGGIGIKIGPGDTLACFRLSSPAEFRHVMEEWLASGFESVELPSA